MTVNPTVKSIVAGIAMAGFYALQAQAAPLPAHSCVNKEDMGFAGLPCTVTAADDDITPVPYELVNPEVNDKVENVESVVNYVFGFPVELTGVFGLAGDTPGFDFTPNTINGVSTVTVTFTGEWTFATIKSSNGWALIDVRGQNTVTLSTDDLIENKNGVPQNFSHISFWNPVTVPAPAGAALLGMGLMGLMAARRRKS